MVRAQKYRMRIVREDIRRRLVQGVLLDEVALKVFESPALWAGLFT